MPFVVLEFSEFSVTSVRNDILDPLLIKLFLFLTRGAEKTGTARKNHPGNHAPTALTCFSSATIHFELTLEITHFVAAVHIV